MPFALIGAGAVLMLTGINDTYSQFFGQLQSDVLAGFFKWALAVLIIGSFGYIDQLRPVSNALLALIIVALFLGNKGGVFKQATAALNQLQSGSLPATR